MESSERNAMLLRIRQLETECDELRKEKDQFHLLQTKKQVGKSHKVELGQGREKEWSERQEKRRDEGTSSEQGKGQAQCRFNTTEGTNTCNASDGDAAVGAADQLWNAVLIKTQESQKQHQAAPDEKMVSIEGDLKEAKYHCVFLQTQLTNTSHRLELAQKEQKGLKELLKQEKSKSEECEEQLKECEEMLKTTEALIKTLKAKEEISQAMEKDLKDRLIAVIPIIQECASKSFELGAMENNTVNMFHLKNAHNDTGEAIFWAEGETSTRGGETVWEKRRGEIILELDSLLWNLNLSIVTLSGSCPLHARCCFLPLSSPMVAERDESSRGGEEREENLPQQEEYDHSEEDRVA